MSSFKNRFTRTSSKASVLLLVLLMTTVLPAFAQSQEKGLVGVIRRLTGLGNDTIWFLQVGAIVIGIIAILSGFGLLWKNQKSGGQAQVSNGAACIIILIGGIMAWVGSAIDTVGETVWGDNGGSRQRITIPN